MTDAERIALADLVQNRTERRAGFARFYILVPNRQQPAVSAEPAPRSVRFLGAVAPPGGQLVAELSEVSVGVEGSGVAARPCLVAWWPPG
jgi:hypothetical protein